MRTRWTTKKTLREQLARTVEIATRATIERNDLRGELAREKARANYLAERGLLLGNMSTADLREVIARYARLIRWLAMPWDANDPYFPQEDPYSGAPLPGNVELAATWREVVRSEG